MTSTAQSPPVIEDKASVVESAFKRAKNTFTSGKTRKYEYRIQQLKNLLKGIKSLEKDLCDAVQKDLGITHPYRPLIMELLPIQCEINHTLKHLKQWMKPTAVDTSIIVGPARSYEVREPLGVCAILGSWNYPLITVLGPLVGAIATGNCVVLKPSEISPFSSVIIKRLIARNLDTSAYVVVQGAVQVAIAMTSTPFDHITFTGSTEKGRLVAGSAAKNLVPCTLELGGKSPCIIDKRADLEHAAQRVAWGMGLNFGQTCIRPDYVLIDTDVVQKFMDMLKHYLGKYYNEGKDRSALGTAVNDFHNKRISNLLKDHGGTLCYGNENAPNDFNMQPAVILNPLQDSPVMSEEIFGPILPVMTYRTIDEAIKFVNGKDKPLVIYYFGPAFRNKTIEKIQNETTSGAFITNDVFVHMANMELGFGGVGGSGYGRYHGKAGFDAFSNVKAVMHKPQLKLWPFNLVLPPYDNSKMNMLHQLFKTLDVTQAALFKRLILVIIALWILVNIIRGRITGKKVKKYYNTVKLIVQFLRNQ